jgi:transglutaminase-like putative cysteine protease
MLYDVSLLLTCTYASPAAGGRHVLYMTPANLPGRQRPITSLLEINPAPDERIARLDFFNNTVVEAAFRASHAEIAFHLRSRVERLPDPRTADLSPLLPGLAREITLNRSLAAEAPHHFSGGSPRVRLAPEFRVYARGQISPNMTVLGVVEAVGQALHRDMKYDPDATDVNTPSEEAFARRHGVCQDFSHIMIGCLRAIGIPAGYVSGFLRTNPPPGKPRLEGADAMHAWVRAWCGAETGWAEYDPTNGMFVGVDHIVVAHGRDYGDVAPVRGIVRTAGSQESSQSVDVVPLA